MFDRLSKLFIENRVIADRFLGREIRCMRGLDRAASRNALNPIRWSGNINEIPP